MADWNDVRRIALSLPETSEQDARSTTGWRVKDKQFVWERPLRKGDIEALGDRAPRGPVLGAMVADLGDKEAVLAEDPQVFFTTPHFNHYPAVLVRLDDITVTQLEQVVVDAWLARAPARLAKAYLSRD